MAIKTIRNPPTCNAEKSKSPFFINIKEDPIPITAQKKTIFWFDCST